jgi:large subunit ribosomal protein L33
MRLSGRPRKTSAAVAAVGYVKLSASDWQCDFPNRSILCIIEEDERGLTARLSVAQLRIWQQGPNKPCVAACQVGGLFRVRLKLYKLLASRGGWPLRRRLKSMREIITLQCPECKNRNYSTTKNKKTTTGRLEFSKFCNTCRKHTAHKETK